MMAVQTVASEDVVCMAIKGGKIGTIDVLDIMEVAAKVLTEDGHGAYRTL